MTNNRPYDQERLPIGLEVIVNGKKTEIISYIASRDMYLVAGIGNPIAKNQLEFSNNSRDPIAPPNFNHLN